MTSIQIIKEVRRVSGVDLHTAMVIVKACREQVMREVVNTLGLTGTVDDKNIQLLNEKPTADSHDKCLLEANKHLSGQVVDLNDTLYSLKEENNKLIADSNDLRQYNRKLMNKVHETVKLNEVQQNRLNAFIQVISQMQADLNNLEQRDSALVENQINDEPPF